MKKYLIHQIMSLHNPLSKGKNKNVIGLMKDELGRKNMAEFVGFTVKTTFHYLIDDDSEDEKTKGTKNDW